MTYTFPLALDAFADRLQIRSVVWDHTRYDEYSGLGSGHDLQAELSPPKWTADMTLAPARPDAAKQLGAIVRKLHGSQYAFMLSDPTSLYPQSDPTGAILGASAVALHMIGADNQSFRLKGLPAGYVMTIGDKGQINFASGARTLFFEISETVTASGAGITPSFEIWPHVPVGVAVDMVVKLAKPACKMILQPKGFTVAQADQALARGGSLRALERK